VVYDFISLNEGQLFWEEMKNIIQKKNTWVYDRERTHEINPKPINELL